MVPGLGHSEVVVAAVFLLQKPMHPSRELELRIADHFPHRRQFPDFSGLVSLFHFDQRGVRGRNNKACSTTALETPRMPEVLPERQLSDFVRNYVQYDDHQTHILPSYTSCLA